MSKALFARLICIRPRRDAHIKDMHDMTAQHSPQAWAQATAHSPNEKLA